MCRRARGKHVFAKRIRRARRSSWACDDCRNGAESCVPIRRGEPRTRGGGTVCDADISCRYHDSGATARHTRRGRGPPHLVHRVRASGSGPAADGGIAQRARAASERRGNAPAEILRRADVQGPEQLGLLRRVWRDRGGTTRRHIGAAKPRSRRVRPLERPARPAMIPPASDRGRFDFRGQRRRVVGATKRIA